MRRSERGRLARSEAVVRASFRGLAQAVPARMSPSIPWAIAARRQRGRAAGSGLDPNVAFVIQRHKPRAPRTRAQDFLYSRSAYRSARLPNRSAENAAEFIARRRASLFADSRADAAA